MKEQFPTISRRFIKLCALKRSLGIELYFKIYYYTRISFFKKNNFNIFWRQETVYALCLVFSGFQLGICMNFYENVKNNINDTEGALFVSPNEEKVSVFILI